MEIVARDRGGGYAGGRPGVACRPRGRGRQAIPSGPARAQVGDAGEEDDGEKRAPWYRVVEGKYKGHQKRGSCEEKCQKLGGSGSDERKHGQREANERKYEKSDYDGALNPRIVVVHRHCIAGALSLAEALEFIHGALHILAGSVGGGADALDAEAEIVRVRGAHDGFF